MRPLLVLFCLLASALALGACGSAVSDREAIEDAIVTSALSDDPEDCARFHTETLLEQGAKRPEPGALEYCEEEVPEDSEDPDSATVREIAIDGDEASAVVELEGGPTDGQVMELDLVQEDGDWKLDELTGFAAFDRAQYMRALRRTWLEEADSGLGVGASECVFERLEELTAAEFEALVLSSRMASLMAIAQDCVHAAESRQQI